MILFGFGNFSGLGGFSSLLIWLLISFLNVRIGFDHLLFSDSGFGCLLLCGFGGILWCLRLV